MKNNKNKKSGETVDVFTVPSSLRNDEGITTTFSTKYAKYILSKSSAKPLVHSITPKEYTEVVVESKKEVKQESVVEETETASTGIKYEEVEIL